MHELSIALSLLDLAAEEAEEQGNVRVRAIHIKLGALAGVAERALRSAFEMARAGTTLADTELLVEEMPIRIRCPRCQAERPIMSMYEFVCAECGTPSAEVTQGRELELVALEIE